MKIKDWSGLLIFSTIVVTVVRYSAAFMASDLGQITGVLSNLVTFFLTLTGFGMGILDVLGGGLLFNGLRKVMPKSGQNPSYKFKVLLWCVITLVVSGLIILVPFTMSRLAHESILDSLGGKTIMAWVWSTMVNLIPYVLIFGVFTGNKMIEDLEEETSRKFQESSKSGEEGSKKVPEDKLDWRKVRPTLSQEQLLELANFSVEQIKLYSKQTGYTYKTISNWRSRAREELGMTQSQGE
jgi:hypothetical protein